MHADNSQAITINVRQSTGTYIAKASGHKPSASCTSGPAHAAEALVIKLGMAAGMLEEHPNVGLAYGVSRFTHPGTPAQPGANYCSRCARKIHTCSCAETSPVYWKTDRVMIDPYDGGTFIDQLRTFEVPRELLELAVSIPTKESVEKNEKAIRARGAAQATIRDLLATGRVAR